MVLSKVVKSKILIKLQSGFLCSSAWDRGRNDCPKILMFKECLCETTLYENVIEIREKQKYTGFFKNL